LGVWEPHPGALFKRGLQVTLSTDDPLQFHNTQARPLPLHATQWAGPLYMYPVPNRSPRKRPSERTSIQRPNPVAAKPRANFFDLFCSYLSQLLQMCGVRAPAHFFSRPVSEPHGSPIESTPPKPASSADSSFPPSIGGWDSDRVVAPRSIPGAAGGGIQRGEQGVEAGPGPSLRPMGRD